MDIADFRTIIALTETGSVTAAARSLCRVPSAITTRIQNIENQLGRVLFVKYNRQFIPTAEGRALYENGLKIIALVNATEHQVHQPQPGGRFRLGALDSMAATRLPIPLSILYRQHQTIEIELTTGISRVLYEAVINHQLDAAFVADAPVDEKLARMAIFAEELVLITAAHCPIIHTANDLQSSTLLVFRDGCSYRDRLTAWLQREQIRPYRLAEMSSYHAIIGGVSAGMGVGIVPRQILDNFPLENVLRRHPFPEADRQVITELIWRKENLTANTRALLDILQTHTAGPNRAPA